MSLITLTGLPTDGTTVDAADITTPLNQLVNDYNGNITNANLASAAAIDGSKLAASSVTNTQLAANAAWAAYTPSWTGATTNPVIGGNGTLTGAYQQIGKTVFVRINLAAGAATTYGSGNYSLSLPITAATALTSGTAIGQAYLEKLGVQGYGGMVVSNTTTTIGVRTLANFNNYWAPTTPFTFASGDLIRLSFTYEAA